MELAPRVERAMATGYYNRAAFGHILDALLHPEDEEDIPATVDLAHASFDASSYPGARMIDVTHALHDYRIMIDRDVFQVREELLSDSRQDGLVQQLLQSIQDFFRTIIPYPRSEDNVRQGKLPVRILKANDCRLRDMDIEALSCLLSGNSTLSNLWVQGNDFLVSRLPFPSSQFTAAEAEARRYLR